MFVLSIDYMRDWFFTMTQQALESTASFMIYMEQEHIHQGVDVTTIYHAFVIRLDINMQCLLDNVQVNKGANGSGSLTWADVVAVYREQLSGVALVSIGTVSGVSTVIEKGLPGIVEVPSVNWGGPSSSVKVLAHTRQVSPSSLQGAVLLEGCR